MIIKIQKNSVDFDQLLNYLMQQFPKYRFWRVSNNTLKVAKGRFWAVYVTVQKNRIKIKGGFASFRYFLAYLLFLIAFGLIIPLAISYIFFYPKLQMLVREIADEVYAFYRQTVLNYTQYGRHDHK